MDSHRYPYYPPHPGKRRAGSRAWDCIMSVCSALQGQFTSSGEEITGRRLLLVTIALMVSAFFGELDRQLLVTAIPKIATELHSLDHAAWYQASHDLARLAFLPIFGRIYTLFPLKLTYCASIVVMVIGAYLLPGFGMVTKNCSLTVHSRLRRLCDVVDFPRPDCRAGHPGHIACWHKSGRIHHNLPCRVEKENATVPGYHHLDDRRRISRGASSGWCLCRELHDLASGLLSKHR